MSRWIVFYDDGTVFSNRNGDPWNAPAVGALILLQINAAGNWVMYERDHCYCWGWREPNEWVPCDARGFEDYIMHHRKTPLKVLFGRWTSDANFKRIHRRANAYWVSRGRLLKRSSNAPE